MKAIQILNWIVKQSISGEILNFVDVPAKDDKFDPQDEEWWLNMFGYIPPAPIPEGKYLYYYSGSADEINFDGEFERVFEPDCTICCADDEELIYFYRMED